MENKLINPSITKDSVVSLREINADTVRNITALSVDESQKKFLATNAESLAEANFTDLAWFRAIYADETPVGFVMTEENIKEGKYWIWRYMIDARYQRFGFGKKALFKVINHIQAYPNATDLLIGVVQEEGGPQEFYQKFGFKLTGEYEYGEAIMKLDLSSKESTANKTVGDNSYSLRS